MATAVRSRAEIEERLTRFGNEIRACGVAHLGLFGSFAEGAPYFGVDYELVWDLVPSRVPELAESIRRMVAG